MAWEDTLNTKSLAHLGITATHVRKIKSGAEFEKYFEPATGKTEVINEEATVHDTLDFVGVLVRKTINDTKQISQVLKRATLNDTCASIFDFFFQNYQYKLDEYGVEQVRRPTRSWADRKTGIDCDCFTASVSSVLTNLGIEHYLKIIAINGKDHFQHIYVVVPKRQGLDINSRANYWVIDPVLDRYNEEAPTITKTKHLKMNGIPLHQLNGLDAIDQLENNFGGLGNEFEGIDEELSGLSGDEETVGRVFRKRLQAHVTNTRRKIESDPQLVAKIYKPDVLLSQMRRLEGALAGNDEAHLDSVLEHLSDTEHTAIVPELAGVYDAIHGHDDYLYGAIYGDIDDNMLSAVFGLGKKGRSAKKAAKANTGKKGFFTKIKNVKKVLKSEKFKGKLKKIGRFIKKANPLLIAARTGFVMAMRVNFAKIAEKAYWGYQTREFAKSKGISDAYYDACVKIKDKIVQVFVKKLGGDEGTIRKPIFNGRAAKKISKALKKKGMSGSTSELFGLGSGLGVAAAAISTTTITAALAFLAPIIKMISGFKKKGGAMAKDENGNAATDDQGNEAEMNTTESEASNPPTGRRSSTIDNDGSIEQADAVNEENPEDFEKKKGSNNRAVNTAKSDVVIQDTNNLNKDTSTDENADESGNPVPDKKSNAGLMIGGVLVFGSIAALLMKGNKKPATTNGLGNFSAKRESKNLKTKVAKAGLKMPHGYTVQKRKNKTVKTIKI
jgi:hypothetical protein